MTIFSRTLTPLSVKFGCSIIPHMNPYPTMSRKIFQTHATRITTNLCQKQPLFSRNEAHFCTIPKDLNPNFVRLRTLKDRFNSRLISQPEAVDTAVQMIKEAVMGFHDAERPLSVLLFAGPTGVGKTQLSKIIAQELGIDLVRFDMSEYYDRHELARFIGSPVGYKDSDMGGQLTNALKQKKVCVVLFDEIEKASPDVYKIFQALFDEGRLTDGRGNTVNGKNAIYIMTTNLGSDIIHQAIEDGYSNREIKKTLRPLLIKTFSPELFNRINHVVMFNPLSKESASKIAHLEIEKLAKQIHNQKKITLSWHDEVAEYFGDIGFDPKMGVRALQRKINDYIKPLIIESYLSSDIQEGADIKLELSSDPLKIDCLELIVMNKGFQKCNVKISQEEGVYIVNMNDQPAENLFDKYSHRSTKCHGDSSYMNKCIVIVGSTPNGTLRYFDQGTLGICRLEPEWNDDKWREPSLTQFPYEFFMNRCIEIKSIETRKECILALDTIVPLIKNSAQKIPKENPLEYILSLCETQQTKDCVQLLIKSLNIQKVIEEDSKEESDSLTFKTDNYTIPIR